MQKALSADVNNDAKIGLDDGAEHRHPDWKELQDKSEEERAPAKAPKKKAVEKKPKAEVKKKAAAKKAASRPKARAKTEAEKKALSLTMKEVWKKRKAEAAKKKG